MAPHYSILYHAFLKKYEIFICLPNINFIKKNQLILLLTMYNKIVDSNELWKNIDWI